MTTSKTNTGTVAFQTWIGCLLVVSLLGTMAYWSGEEMLAIVKTEVASIRSIFCEWPADTAIQWWKWLRLDQIESEIVQQILKSSRGNDPLRALADQINRFFCRVGDQCFWLCVLGVHKACNVPSVDAVLCTACCDIDCCWHASA